nr:MAG TPA_asm: hypothetical protein [Caudoviricetes sp.]
MFKFLYLIKVLFTLFVTINSTLVITFFLSLTISKSTKTNNTHKYYYYCSQNAIKTY